jgi:hypothetical protein
MTLSLLEANSAAKPLHLQLSPTNRPLIQPSRDLQVDGTTITVPSPELRGDLAVHGFWTRGQTSIFDVCITDTDQPSNRNTDPSKVLLQHEKEKKDNYGALCIARRRTFTPLFFLWMASLAKKQPQHRNALLPVLLPSGNVPTQRYVAMPAPDSPLHSFAPLAAASELIAPQLKVFEIPCGILVLGWDYIECNSYW